MISIRNEFPAEWPDDVIQSRSPQMTAPRLYRRHGMAPTEKRGAANEPLPPDVFSCSRTDSRVTTTIC